MESFALNATILARSFINNMTKLASNLLAGDPLAIRMAVSGLCNVFLGSHTLENNSLLELVYQWKTLC